MTLTCLLRWRSFALPCGSSRSTCSLFWAAACALALPAALVRLHPAQLRAAAGLGADRACHVSSHGDLFPSRYRAWLAGQPTGGAADRPGAAFRTDHLRHLAGLPSLAIVPAAVTAALLHAISGIVRLFSGHGRRRHSDLQPRAPFPRWRHSADRAGDLGGTQQPLSRVRSPSRRSPASAAVSSTRGHLLYRPGELEVTAIDVGQGDSLLLVSPQGKTLLVDAGGPTGGAPRAPAPTLKLAKTWSRRSCGRAISARLDAVALTHAHSDHMGGMSSVLRNFRPRVLLGGHQSRHPGLSRRFWPRRSASTFRSKRWLPAAASRSADARSMCLLPRVDYAPAAAASNDDSLVLHVTYGRTSVLLEGDAEAATERADAFRRAPRRPVEGRSPRQQDVDYPPVPGCGGADICRHLRWPTTTPMATPKSRSSNRLQDGPIRTFRTDALGATSFYLDGTSVTAEALAGR